jgi:hypothetical protein
MKNINAKFSSTNAGNRALRACIKGTMSLSLALGAYSPGLAASGFESNLLDLEAEIAKIEVSLKAAELLKAQQPQVTSHKSAEQELSKLQQLLANGDFNQVVRSAEQMQLSVMLYDQNSRLKAAIICADALIKTNPSQVLEQLTTAFQLATTDWKNPMLLRDVLLRMDEWLRDYPGNHRSISKILASFNNAHSANDLLQPSLLIAGRIAERVNKKQIAKDLYQQVARNAKEEAVRAEGGVQFARLSIQMNEPTQAYNLVTDMTSSLKDVASQKYRVLRLFEARLRIAKGDFMGAEPILLSLTKDKFLGAAALEDLTFNYYRMNQFRKASQSANKFHSVSNNGSAFVSKLPAMRALIFILAGKGEQAKKELEKEDVELMGLKQQIQQYADGPSFSNMRNISKATASFRQVISVPNTLNVINQMTQSIEALDAALSRQRSDLGLLRYEIANHEPDEIYIQHGLRAKNYQKKVRQLTAIGADLVVGSASLAGFINKQGEAKIEKILTSNSPKERLDYEFRDRVHGYRNWLNLNLIEERLGKIHRLFPGSFKGGLDKSDSFVRVWGDVLSLKIKSNYEHSGFAKLIAEHLRKTGRILDFKSRTSEIIRDSLFARAGVSVRDLDRVWGRWENLSKLMYQSLVRSQGELKTLADNDFSEVVRLDQRLLKMKKALGQIRQSMDDTIVMASPKIAGYIRRSIDRRRAKVARWIGDSQGLKVTGLQQMKSDISDDEKRNSPAMRAAH